MGRALRVAAGLGVAAVLLWLFLRGIDVEQVWRAVGAASPWWLAASLALSLLHHLVRAWRWRMLLAPLRPRVPLRPLVEGILAGYAVSFVAPGRLGEVVRPAYVARREKLPFAGTLVTVGLDRILDMGTLALLLAAFLLLAPASGPGALALEHAVAVRRAGLVAGGLVLALLPVLWLMARFRDRIPEPAGGAGWAARGWGVVRGLLEGLAVLHGPRPLLGAVAGSLAIWLVLSAQAWCGLMAFRIDLPFIASFVLQNFLALGIALPTPAGVGGYHAMGRFCLEGVLGVAPGAAVAAVLVLHVISVLPPMLLGGWVLAREGASLGQLRGGAAGAGEPGPARGRP